MIVTDTTNVNNGKSGVVIFLQVYCKPSGLTVLQYVECKHYVLDSILKHFMNQEFAAKTSSPSISYEFVEKMQQNNDDLKNI